MPGAVARHLHRLALAGLLIGGHASAETDPFERLRPPEGEGPVVVQAAFELRDVNEIDDLTETFEFTGVLSLEWTDPRQAFTPSEPDAERVFQGAYQFDELAPSWFPQVVLRNESGPVQQSGTVLRVQPDGRSTLTQTVMAVAETDLDLRWFPFDSHRLEAEFVVLGFGADEVVFAARPQPDGVARRAIEVPQWDVVAVTTHAEVSPVGAPDQAGPSSRFVLAIDVERESFFMRRLVTFPLSVIVLLSFAVFWMDRSSLGDRISVSFIGILTAVTYQLVMWDAMPHISYFTLMHGFLLISFVTMCGTVVVNLLVGSLDTAGREAEGDRVDRICRWIFPLAYVGAVMALFGTAEVLF